MADDTRLEVDIEANVGGSADAKQLADAIESISSALGDLAGQAKSAQRVTDNVARSLAGATTEANNGVKGLKALADSYKEVASAQKSVADGSKKVTAGDFRTPTTNSGNLANPNRIVSSTVGNLSTKASRESADATAYAAEQVLKYQNQVNAAIQQEIKIRREAVAAARDQRLAAQNNAQLETGTGSGSAKAVADRFQASGFLDAQDSKARTQAYETERQALRNLTNARYALYDVSNTAAIAGAGILAFNGLVVKAAADYETAMAQISRTSGAAGVELQGIRSDFIDLAQSIPVAFTELSKIGTLAGQLNIPADSIASFTETTAKFAATTNVSSEAAATAFGRLDTLLPDVQGRYENLGSSILQVGVNSVATETEIINTANQIAAAGAQAGLTADQVIGLAGSFASLGVAPEAARGTAIRVLSEIRQAVTEGGDALETFAGLSGKTADDFRNQWSSDAGGAIIDVLEGLQKEGAGAEQTLRGLGITAVRDINALLRLSQNVDTVKDSFADANTGFAQGTQLGDAFGVQAETLASKLQVLVNSVQAFFASIGQSGLGPIGQFIDGLNDILNVAAELAQNPTVQWIAAFAGAATLLTGVALLLASAMIRVSTTSIALRTAFADLAVEANRAGGGMTGLTAALFGSSAAAGVLRGALVSTGIGAFVVLLGVATAGITEYANNFKTGAERAKDSFGTFSDLSAALSKDTEAVKAGAEEFGQVTGKITTTTEATSKWTGELANATDGALNIANASTAASTAIDNVTFSIGANTAALLANKLASDQSIQDLITNAAKYNTLQDAAGNATNGGQAFDINKVLTLAAQNDTKGAQAYLDQYREYLKSVGASVEAFNVQIGTGAERAISLTTGALQEAANQSQINTVVNNALGVSATGAGADLEDMGDSAGTAADDLKALQDAVAAGFATQNAVGDLSSSFYDLVYAITESGNSFDAFDQVGQKNLESLQTSIVNSIVAGKQLGVSATESVAVLFQQLQNSGVTTARLLSTLASINIPGVNKGQVSSLLGGQQQLTASGGALSTSLSRVAGSAREAAEATKSAGAAAASAAQKIVTLVDYANDLSGVFKRAFDIRYGGDKALDAISSSWMKIQQNSEDARKAIDKANLSIRESNDRIREARAAIDELTSDRAIQEYFLTVAENYGDALRAGEIRAQLAKINAEIESKNTDIVKSQQDINDATDDAKKASDKASKGLTGNSEAAIENRAALTGLVSQYQDYLTELASSGLSQDQLRVRAAQLRAEFVQQATQLGYSVIEVEKYAQSFDDMSLAIQRVPRNITVTADPNPALQALNEFIAKARETAANSGISVPISTRSDNSGAADNLRATRDAYQTQLEALYKVTGGNSNVNTGRLEQAIVTINNKLRSMGYKSGGYTGDGGTSAPAGVVHGKEFVVDAPNTARLGLGFLNSLNNGGTPVAGGSAGGRNNIMVVELSATDRALLSALGDIQVNIPGVRIAQATTSANLNAASRGSK